MKVVKKDNVPTVLMIMGLVMTISSSMEWMDRNRDLLFVAGIAIALLGFLLWAVPSLDRFMKKQSRKREHMDRMRSPEPSGRAPPRTRR